MTNEKTEVKDDKEQPRPVSTCFEGLPSAEMMQKIMGETGIGSLSAEMMRTSVKTCGQGQEETPEASKAMEENNENFNSNGGVK